MLQKKNLFLMMAACLVFASCNNQTEEVKENKEEKIIVQTDFSKEITYSPEITYSGVAKPNQEANLGSPFPGRVEKLYFNSGDFVTEGQTIARLSQNLLEQSNAELEAVQKDHDRVKRLYEKGSLTAQDFDHVDAKLKATKAQNAMFVSFSEVKAPFSGKIVDFLVNEGEVFTIAPGLDPGYSMTSGIVRLMDLNKIKVCFEINEKEYAMIKDGQNVQVCFDSYPDTVFNGKISHIDDYLSTMTHTAEIEVTVNNTKQLIKPGMFARVSVVMPQVNAVFVPQEAIYKLEGTGDEYVYTCEENIVHRISIERGENYKELVAVEGIQANTEILTSGLRKVQEGSVITKQNN